MVIGQIRPDNDGELYYGFWPLLLASEMQVQELEVKVTESK